MARTLAFAVVACSWLATGAYAQNTPQAPNAARTEAVTAAVTPASKGIETPPGYVIGVQDVFDVVVWKDEEMSAEGVVVGPDGRVSLPLVNEIHAAGLTVEQLRQEITKKAGEFVQEPTVSVVVKEINSLRVSIVGQVGKPAQYALLRPTTVVELISMAGGVAEYANTKNIRITRTENGKPVSLQFNYNDFLKGKEKALAQNIELKPGDIVTVP